IALVTNGSHLGGGYICDGYKLAVWLRPANLKGVQLPLDTKGAQAMLINRGGRTVGKATFSPGISTPLGFATGSVTINGAANSFRTRFAVGYAGLYRTASGTPGEPGFRETGQIVLSDGHGSR